MNKSITHSFEGMMQDISTAKFPNQFYFEGKNIRILATNSQSTKDITNEKGNSLVITVPIPTINHFTKVISYDLKTLSYTNTEIDDNYHISAGIYEQSGTQVILGHTTSRNNIILFTTDNNGFDCIWKINDETYDITLLYLRDLGFKTTNPIQVLNNYENENIDKVYWVDSLHQLRFINIEHSITNEDLEELIDLNSNILNMVGEFNFTQPVITDIIGGGIHTAGMIQYAYNLYKLNSSQTKISPLSELVALDNDVTGGGAINEVVSKTPVINIDTLDSDYTNIKLYYIKYTSFNEIPEIALIADRNIVGLSEFTYYDDGNIIQNLSLEEFLFLGSDIIIPKHINSKFNRLFLANYKEKNYDLNIDTRAYSFPISTDSVDVYNSLYVNDLNVVTSNEPPVLITSDYINGTTFLPETHSAINIDYNTNMYQYNSTLIGGEGPYLSYELIRSETGVNGFTDEDAELKFFKDRELYRVGIQFYNTYGQTSLPKWIADFIVTDINGSNLERKYAGIKINLKPLFYVWLNTQSNFLDENGNYDEKLKPIGYKLLRADRTLLDRSILCQGVLNGMMSNNKNGVIDPGSASFSPQAIMYANAGDKLPSLMRRFDDELCPQYKMASYDRLDRPDATAHPELIPNFPPYQAGTEVKQTTVLDDKFSETFQFNMLMQMFSPEILFNSIQNLNNNLSLSVFGALENDYNAFWGQRRRVDGKNTITEAKVYNAISPYDVKSLLPGNLEEILGNELDLAQEGLFCVPEGTGNMSFIQTYRRYLSDYVSLTTPLSYDFYGKPLIVEKGQGRTIYNNDPDMVFYNSLEPLTTDGGRYLTSVNSWGVKNITFALGADGLLTENRTALEDIHTSTGFNDDVCILSEIKIPNNIIYVGNLYGGNVYESKKTTNYIEIGQYQLINNTTYTCVNPGDTFVSQFKFTKLVKTDTEVYSDTTTQHTEIVEFVVETTIDLKNRNDLSLSVWDARFQPQDSEYQQYNTVYSQEANFIQRRDLNYNFKKINNFDTGVICTKLKTPGELIDNWTDIEVNNVLYLNGKYGPINCLHSYKDELYTLQDSGFALLSIQPRVQISGSDGLALQLGTGTVLDRYQYISTESGTLNKWSVISSPSSMYYYDTLNKSLNVFNGQLKGLSDEKGMHIHFTNNTVLNELRIDNPLLGSGVNSGYDYINNDMFMTFHQGEGSFTISYNEAKDYFTSFYDYIPNRYISRGNYILAVNPENNKIYKQYEGDYNVFFDTYYPSYVILNVNPEADKDCIFDNINFKSDVTLNNVDQVNVTLTDIQAYNDYQDSTLIPLVVGRNNNLRRKFRDWNALVPRQNRNRIRAPYIKLKLQFNNKDNYKIILHDINVYYTV